MMQFLFIKSLTENINKGEAEIINQSVVYQCSANPVFKAQPT